MAARGAEESIIDKLGPTEGEVLGDLGGVVDAPASGDQLYDLKFKQKLDAQPKKAVWIPGEYAEIVQVNGVTYKIDPEQVVMVPETVADVLKNQKDLERAVARKQARLKKLMSPGSIAEVPEYVR